MPMMPKRVKFRKSQRGKNRGSGKPVGTTVAFGEFGLAGIKSMLGSPLSRSRRVALPAQPLYAA